MKWSARPKPPPVLPDGTFDFSGFDAAERAAVCGLVETWDSDKLPPEYHALVDLDYKYPFPKLEQFVEDPYYLGTEGRELFPFWKDALYECAGEGSTVSKIIATGPIGTGKTTFSLFNLLYKMCWCTCLRNPQEFLGLMESSAIVFGIYSVTKDNVQLASYHQAMSLIKSSPFFRDKFEIRMDQEYKSQVLWLPGNVFLRAGSRELHALSLNLFGVLLEEVNFRIEKDPVASAYGLLNNTERRIQSRYMRSGAFMPGVIIINSSKKHQTDFLDRHINESRGDPNVRVYSAPIWEIRGIKPGQKRSCRGQVEYSGGAFKVSCGSQLVEPKILEPEEIPPPDLKVIDVPVEYRVQFERDIYGALQDIAGESTASTHKFFPNLTAFVNSVSAELKNPMSRDTIEMTIKTLENIFDFVVFDNVFVLHQSRYTPRRHPFALRYAHFDYSKNVDYLGIGIVHVAGTAVDISRDRTGLEIKMVKPIIEVDFCFRLTSDTAGTPIDYEKVRAFVLWLSRHGVRFGKLTFDQFQSQDTINSLHKAGYPAAEDSVERGSSDEKRKQSYVLWKKCVLENRYRIYNQPDILKEAAELDDLPKKIDHPETNKDGTPGTKDLCDAQVGATRNALLDKNSTQLDNPEAMAHSHGPASVEKRGMKSEDNWITADYNLGEELHYTEDQREQT